LAKEMRGIFTIPQTPFQKDEKGVLELDEKTLREEVNFCVEAGAHGIVMPVLASEFPALCEDERKRIAETVVEETRKRIPTVIGVAGVNTRMAVGLSRHAQEVGGDAVIAMPPYVTKLSFEEIYGYYKAISDSIDLPIFIQNAAGNFGSALPPAQVAKLVKGIRNVKYVKEETPPTGHSITAVLESCGEDVLGVFGGAGGRYLIEELERGAAGNMPACEFTDILAEIYDLYSRGDEEAARRLHGEFLPLINLTVGEGPIMKEVLRMRGILKTTHSRVPQPPLDEYDLAELKRNLRALEEHFEVHPPKF